MIPSPTHHQLHTQRDTYLVCVCVCVCFDVGSSEDPPGPGSMSNLESANELNSDDPTVTSDPDDPELTSDSDSETTSDEEMSSDSDDPDLTSDPDDARIAVLEAALVHVPSLGWTAAALEAGASDMELDQSVDEMFPRCVCVCLCVCVCVCVCVRVRVRVCVCVYE